MSEAAPTSIFDLPQHCLVLVLRHLTGDPVDYRSLMHASAAHSTFNQAARVALSSISTVGAQQPQKLSNLMCYCHKHGQHITSIAVDSSRTLSWGGSAPHLDVLDETPPTLQPDSISFTGLQLRLSPGDGFAGLQAAGASLKQLYLQGCELLDRPAGMLAALSQMPQLQRLSVYTPSDAAVGVNEAGSVFGSWGPSQKPGEFAVAGAFPPELSQLSYLALQNISFSHPAPLLHLTALRTLCVLTCKGVHFSADVLQDTLHLTGLQVSGLAFGMPASSPGPAVFDPAVLAQQTSLKHLTLQYCGSAITAAGSDTEALLSAVGQLQQLTHLDLTGSTLQSQAPSAAAYSSLAASSNLAHLDVSAGKFPPGAWEHVLPNGRQMLQLRVLRWCPLDAKPSQQEVAAIVKGCPGLTALAMYEPAFGDIKLPEYFLGAKLLEPLLDLTPGLQQLQVAETDAAGVRVLAGLNSLRDLEVGCDRREKRLTLADNEALLWYTQLKHLTFLNFRRAFSNTGFIYYADQVWGL